MMFPVRMQVFACILQGGALCHPAPLSSFVSVACIFPQWKLSFLPLFVRERMGVHQFAYGASWWVAGKERCIFFPFKDQSRDHPLCGSSKGNQADTFQPLQAFNDIFLVFFFKAISKRNVTVWGQVLRKFLSGINFQPGTRLKAHLRGFSFGMNSSS